MPRSDAVGLLELLGDPVVQRILVHTSERPRSASELADQCDVSKPTVYRRLEALERHDLVHTETRFDDDGNHYTIYACRLEEVTFGVGDDGVTVELTRRRAVADDT